MKLYECQMCENGILKKHNTPAIITTNYTVLFESIAVCKYYNGTGIINISTISNTTDFDIRSVYNDRS